jgi:hypothetical protein
MLKFGVRIKSSKEILGQIPRLLVGGVKSFAAKFQSEILEEQMFPVKRNGYTRRVENDT